MVINNKWKSGPESWGQCAIRYYSSTFFTTKEREIILTSQPWLDNKSEETARGSRKFTKRFAAAMTILTSRSKGQTSPSQLLLCKLIFKLRCALCLYAYALGNVGKREVQKHLPRLTDRSGDAEIPRTKNNLSKNNMCSRELTAFWEI